MSNSNDKTYLAIDYGERRIGLAKSDPTGTIASALETIKVKSAADGLTQVIQRIKEYQPQGVVIGYPLLPSGDKSKKCFVIEEFIEKLSKVYKGSIYRVDESYSTQEAADIIHAHGKKVGKNKQRLDRLAAVLILQRFLNEN